MNASRFIFPLKTAHFKKGYLTPYPPLSLTQQQSGERWCSMVNLCSTILATFLLLAMCCPWLPHLSTLAQVVWVRLQVLVVTGLTRDGGRSLLSRTCRLPPAQWLGRHSLHLYLPHDPVIKLAIFRLQQPQEELATILGSTLVTFTLSFTFARVEKLVMEVVVTSPKKDALPAGRCDGATTITTV